MYNNTRKILAGALVLTLSFGVLLTNAANENTGSVATDNATDNASASTSGAFSITETKVVDNNTLSVTFNKDLLEDVSMFEFSLTSKADESKEISLTGVVLSSPNELKVDTNEVLNANEDYNLVVIFASDKEGNVIENGVDGMVTFKTPEVFPAEKTSVEGDLNAAPTEASTTELNATESGTTQPVETVAGDTKALPETGPKEMMFVILAMLLGLGVMVVRKKA